MRELVERPAGAAAEDDVLDIPGAAGAAGEEEAEGAEDADDDGGIVKDVRGAVVFCGVGWWRCL